MTQPQPIFPGAHRAAGYVESAPPQPTAPAPAVEAEPTPAAPVDVAQQATAIQAPPTPEGAPADGSVSADDLLGDPYRALTEQPIPAQDAPSTVGMRGALNRLGLKLKPTAAEVDARKQAEEFRTVENTIRQATWTRAVSVLVANRKGGVGKTPTALILGGVLASIRGGSVAIMEVSDDPGQLGYRAEGSPTRGLGELMRDVASIQTAGQLTGYTAPQTSFASVIGSIGPRPRLEYADVVAIARLVDEFFGIRVMDSGNQPTSTAFAGALETADALVIPVVNAGDAVLDAVALLEDLRSRGEHAAALADSAVIARLVDGRPEHPQVVDRITRVLTGAKVRAIVTVPYDQHIAERAAISLSSISPVTRQAFTRIAAEVVRQLQTVVR